MARPAKDVDVSNKHFTKEEVEARKKAQEKINGQADKIKPPNYLNRNQKAIFRFIVEEMEACGLLCNLDNYILVECCCAIDGMQAIQKKLNEDPEAINDRNLINTKKDYTNIFFRCCNELCLSPQSRAKMAISIAQKMAQEEDPLLKALRDDDDD